MSGIFSILTLLLLACYAFVLRRHLVAWKKQPTNRIDDSNPIPGVTVVIVARNEKENLIQLLNQLNSQSFYGELEIILVDDQSTDGTAALANSFKNVVYHRLETDSLSTKKEGIKWAAENAKWDIILQTDADCDLGRDWVKLMSSMIREDTVLGLGPVSYKYESSNWKRVLRIEMHQLSLLAGSSTFLNRNFISNGANLVYHRNLIIKLNPFADVLNPSGDDTSLVKTVQDNGNSELAYCKNSEAIVRTYAPSNFKHFFHQRLRWSSKVNFTGSNKLDPHALAFLFGNLAIILALSWTLINSNIILFAIAVFIKFVIDSFSFDLTEKFFAPKEPKSSLLLRVVLVLFYPFYIAFFAVLSKFVPYQWKGRKISPWKK